MARSHLRLTLKDKNGNAIENALLQPYLHGTTTPVTDAWSAETGGVAVSVITTNSQGEAECWVDVPKAIDVSVTDNSGAAFLAGTPTSTLSWTTFSDILDVVPPPSETAQTTRPQTITALWTFSTIPQIAGSNVARVAEGPLSILDPRVTPNPATVTDYGAQLTAALALVPSDGGHIYIPGGRYPMTTSFHCADRTGVTISGAGLGTILDFTGSVTEIMRFDNASRCALSNFRINHISGTVTHGIHITIPNPGGSTENFDARWVMVNGNGFGTLSTLTNAFAVGADTTGDVAEIVFDNCRGSSVKNGWVLGNGTAGNVLNIHADNCDARLAEYGVIIQGSTLTWKDGSLGGNTSADFKLSVPGNGVISITGVRTEQSKKFWECITAGTAAVNISLSNINVAHFTESTGKVIDHACSYSLSMRDCHFRNGPVPVAMNIVAVSTNPLSFVAENIITDSDNPFGALTNVVACISNLRKDVGGVVVPVSTGNVTALGEAVDARQWIQMTEQAADPAAPALNGGRLFLKDNGSGKTQLCIRFATGAVQVIATEP